MPESRYALLIVRVIGQSPPLSLRLLKGTPRIVIPLLVHVFPISVGTSGPHQLRHRFYQETKDVSRLSERFFGAFVLVVIRIRADPFPNAPFAIMDCSSPFNKPSIASLLSP